MKPLAEQNHYELLEVAPDATAEQIDAAFAKAMAFYGPDSIAVYSLVPAEEAKALVKRIEDAYLVLTDPDARQEYDQEHGLRPPEVPEPAEPDAPAAAEPSRTPAAWMGSSPYDDEDEPPAAAAVFVPPSLPEPIAAVPSAQERTAPEPERTVAAAPAPALVPAEVPESSPDGAPEPVREATRPIDTAGDASESVSEARDSSESAPVSLSEPAKAAAAGVAAEAGGSEGAEEASEPKPEPSKTDNQGGATLPALLEPTDVAPEPKPKPTEEDARAEPSPTPEAAATTEPALEPEPEPGRGAEPAPESARPVEAALEPNDRPEEPAPEAAPSEDKAAPTQVSGQSASPVEDLSRVAKAPEAPMPAQPLDGAVPDTGKGAEVQPPPLPRAAAKSAVESTKLVQVTEGLPPKATDLAPEPVEPLPAPPSALVRASAGASTGAGRAKVEPVERRDGPPSKPSAKGSEIAPDAVFTGEVLRRIRESRGLSQRELSDRTKIGLAHIENIEADHYGAMPVTVYLRGFLMSMARELKLDPLKVSKSYLELVSKAKQKG